MTPLPFAPPPKDSNLYQQLESTTLNTLTPEQLDTIRAKTFSQGTEGNEDEYRRLLLLGLASDKLSLSGPMPKTSKIVTATVTGSPAAGEVWSIQGFAQNKTGSFTAGVTGYLIVDDGSQSTAIDMAIRRINSSTADPQEDTDFGTPVFVDENMTVKYRAYSTGFGDSIEGQIYCIRVR